MYVFARARTRTKIKLNEFIKVKSNLYEFDSCNKQALNFCSNSINLINNPISFRVHKSQV